MISSFFINLALWIALQGDVVTAANIRSRQYSHSEERGIRTDLGARNGPQISNDTPLKTESQVALPPSGDTIRRKLSTKAQTRYGHTFATYPNEQGLTTKFFPYYVEMQGCSGTLIAPDVVLSAAHCMGVTGVGSTVSISGYDEKDTKSPIRVRIVDQEIHPHYNQDASMTSNFALFRLEREVIFPEGHIKLFINRDLTTPMDGQTLTALSPPARPSSTGPHEAQVQIDTDCGDWDTAYDSNSMVCAGYTGEESTCQGDSGGPLVSINGNEHTLVGIGSFIDFPCGNPEYPDVYARVSSAIDWMEGIMCEKWNGDGIGTAVNNPFCDAGVATSIGSSDDNSKDRSKPSSDTSDTTKEACSSVQIIFKTDDFPQDNRVVLTSSQEGILVEGGDLLQQNTEYMSDEVCIRSRDCVVLDITDDSGDGLLGGGFVELKWNGESILKESNIGYGLRWELTNGCEEASTDKEGWTASSI